MKRLFAVFTLCATTLIAASAVSSPAAADGRHDGRHGGWRQAGQSDRQMSRVFTDRGEHRRASRVHRDRRYQKFRHRHMQQRYAKVRRHGHRNGYGYSQRRDRHRYRPGPAYAFWFDGGRFIIRLD